MNDQSASRYLRQLAACMVAIPLVLSLYIALWPMAFSDRAFALWTHQLEIARGETSAHEQTARVLILGDSRVQAAVIPQAVGPGVLNLALMSSTPIDAYYLMRDYLEHHAAPETVVLSFAPYHLQRGHERFFWNHSVKYGAHGWGDFLEILDHSERLDEPLLPNAGRARVALEWSLYRARFAPYYLPELKAAKGFTRRAENRAARDRLAAGLGHFAFGQAEGSSAIAKEAEYERFEPSPLLDRYLRDLLALCTTSGSGVIVRAMPFNESSRGAIQPQYALDYARYTDALRADHPRITADAQFAFLPDCHFGDGSHLNERGARRLSADLRDELADQAERLATSTRPRH